MNGSPPTAAALVIPFLLLATAAPAAAQTLRGRVLDEVSGQPLPQTVVRLVGPDSGAVSVNLSSLDGGYLLAAPAPGRYVLEADRIGYAPYRSAEIELPRAGATYGVDLVLRAEPLAIEGLKVTAERRREVEDKLRLLIGGSVAGLRNAPILRDAIERSLRRGHDIASMLGAQALPSIFVEDYPPDPPCVRFRGRTCLPVHLDGARLQPDVVRLLPLEMIEAAVVVQPNESIIYEGGAVLLYTTAWIGPGR